MEKLCVHERDARASRVHTISVVDALGNEASVIITIE
jgi:hypothetical protein